MWSSPGIKWTNSRSRSYSPPLEQQWHIIVIKTAILRMSNMANQWPHRVFLQIQDGVLQQGGGLPNTYITAKLHCSLMTASLFLQLTLRMSWSLAPPRTTRPCEAWTELHTAGKSGRNLRGESMSLPPPLPPCGNINRLYLEGASSHSRSDEDGNSCYK